MAGGCAPWRGRFGVARRVERECEVDVSAVRALVGGAGTPHRGLGSYCAPSPSISLPAASKIAPFAGGRRRALRRGARARGRRPGAHTGRPGRGPPRPPRPNPPSCRSSRRYRTSQRRAVLWSAWLGPRWAPTSQQGNDKVRGLANFKSEFRASKNGEDEEAKAYFNGCSRRTVA